MNYNKTIKSKTFGSLSVVLMFAIGISLVGLPNADALTVDASAREAQMETLVEEYASIAESSFQLEDEMKAMEASMKLELLKEFSDTNRITLIQAEIDRLSSELDRHAQDARLVQETLDRELEMDPKLEAQLEKARKILLDSRDTIPWSGLGTSKTSQAVEIAIVSSNPESYRVAIEELIGADVPLVIKEGSENPFATCSSRTQDCSYLQGGLRITGTGQCTLGFPVQKGTDYGYLTAGHCYPTNTVVKQPYGTSGIIGTVTVRNWNALGDTAFIKQNSLDVWDAGKVYKSANNEYSGINTKVNPSSTALIAMSGASSNFIDWGYVDSTVWTCTDGVVTSNNMYRTQSTQALSGDSGAPVFDPTYNVKKFYGTVSCWESSTDNDMVFENWDTIVARLGVS